MSTITTSSLSDTLPSSVPKLDAEGDNWAIFLVRFMDAVEAKGFWGHFDGTSTLPVTTSASSTAEIAAKTQWEKDERSAKTLLTQRLPDSTVMEIHSKKTVKERWEAVVKEYTVKGVYAQTEMRAKFLTSRCSEKGNAKDFLRGLRLKKEELVQVGVKISDKDYLSTIISSLPDALSNFASMQMSWTLQQTQQSMDASTLMTMLLQEAERQDLRSQRRKQATGKAKEDEKSEALAVSMEKPRGKRDMSKISCWNCGELGHFSSKCDKPRKSKDSESSVKPDPKKEETSAAAVDSSSDDEGAWAADEIEDDGADWFQEVVDSENEADSVGDVADWFEEVVGMLKPDGSDEEESDWFEEAVAEEDLEGNSSRCSNLVSVEDELGVHDDLPELLSLSDSEDEDSDIEEEFSNWEKEGVSIEDSFDTLGEVFVVAESVPAAWMAKLYNSGCTNHFSPYRSQFENFQGTTPRNFRAVNKQTFSTMGKGDLVIDVPHGHSSTQLRLHDMLYSLYSAEVGYTLVSVGRLDEARFTVTFGGGKCVLKGEDDVEKGTKLGGRVRGGKWLGVDEESKGARVYWPDNKTVTVERNIYYENPSVNRFEEEEEPVEIVKTNVDLPAAPNPPVVCDEAPENAYTDAPETSDTETAEKRARKPGLAYWEAVKWISKYLKGTRELWLGYGEVTKELVGYADADGSTNEDRKAISGYTFMINGGAVSWSAKRQEIISLSTTESEYIAATYAAKEALWLRQLILQLFGILLPATPLFCDNQSAIALAKEHQYHARTKHIDVRFHFIRWIIEDNKLRLIYCPTDEMVAHILTKALVSTKVKHFASELGLVPL